MKNRRWQKSLTMMMAGFMALGVAGTSFAAAMPAQDRIPAYDQQYQPEQAKQANDKNKADLQKEKAPAAEKNNKQDVRNQNNPAASDPAGAKDKNLQRSDQPPAKDIKKDDGKAGKAPAEEETRKPAPEKVSSSTKNKKTANNAVRDIQKEAETAAVIKAASGLLS